MNIVQEVKGGQKVLVMTEMGMLFIQDVHVEISGQNQLQFRFFTDVSGDHTVDKIGKTRPGSDWGGRWAVYAP